MWKGLALLTTFIAAVLAVVFQDELQIILGTETATYLKYAAHALLSFLNLYAIYVVFIRKHLPTKKSNT